MNKKEKEKIKRDIMIFESSYEYKIFGLFKIRLNPYKLIVYNNEGTLEYKKYGIISSGSIDYE